MIHILFRWLCETRFSGMIREDLPRNPFTFMFMESKFESSHLYDMFSHEVTLMSGFARKGNRNTKQRFLVKFSLLQWSHCPQSYGQMRYWQPRTWVQILTTSYRTLGKTFVFPDSVLSSKEILYLFLSPLFSLKKKSESSSLLLLKPG